MPSGEYDRARRLHNLGWEEDGEPLSEVVHPVAQLALEAGLLTQDQVGAAVREHEEACRRGKAGTLADLLVTRGWLRPADVQALLAQARGTAPSLTRYELLCKIGEGATAVVYRGWDRQLGRPVAIKILRDSFALNETARRRFQREGRTSAALTHPHIISVYDTGEAEGRPFLVMELVDGRSLATLLAEGQSQRTELLRLVEQAALGVAEAHAKGVIHRDLKPGNILVTSSGETKVGDFGLAHLVDSGTELTRTGVSLGTPLYMSPEQVRGSGETTPSTDVYALGAILYEVLTGHPPHSGATTPELYRKILEDEPIPPRKIDPTIPVDLETVTLRALDKVPSRRYPGGGVLAEDLRRHRVGDPILARPAGIFERGQRNVRKHPAAFALGGVVIAATALTLTVWAAGIERARRENARFLSEREEAVRTLREVSRLSVDTALKLRRRGQNAAMRDTLPALEQVYQQATVKAPNLPEVDYLMGRMWRALMAYHRALACQEKAIRKDPEYGPARYERALLVARRLRELKWEIPERQKLAAAGNDSLEPGTQKLRTDYDRILATVLADVETVQRSLSGGRPGEGGPWLKEANALAMRGIAAFLQDRRPEATDLLREATRQDPTLEEAWETLAELGLSSTDDDKKDSLERWKRAEECYTEALEHDRGYIPHLLGRSRLRTNRAAYFARRGVDPMPDLVAAAEDASRVLELSADSVDGLKQKAAVHVARAEQLVRRGEDGSADLAAAERALTEALRLNSSLTGAWRKRAEVYLAQADERIRRVQDPIEKFGLAVEDFSRASETATDSAFYVFRRSETRLQMALHRARGGGDPWPDFAAAEEDATRAIGIMGQYEEAWAQRGHVRREWARRRERDADSEGALREYEGAASDYEEAVRLRHSLEGPLKGPLQEVQARAAELRKRGP